MRRLAEYSKKTEDIFQFSFAAIYAPRDITYGMVRMFETYYELGGHPINVSIFRNKEEAIHFLTDKKSMYG